MKRAALLALLTMASVVSVFAAPRLSTHARARMRERGVSEAQVRRVLETAAPFQYRHQGRRKTGYYDEASGIFIAAQDGAVITVITKVTRRYVENLKRENHESGIRR